MLSDCFRLRPDARKRGVASKSLCKDSKEDGNGQISQLQRAFAGHALLSSSSSSHTASSRTTIVTPTEQKNKNFRGALRYSRRHARVAIDDTNIQIQKLLPLSDNPSASALQSDEFVFAEMFASDGDSHQVVQERQMDMQSSDCTIGISRRTGSTKKDFPSDYGLQKSWNEVHTSGTPSHAKDRDAVRKAGAWSRLFARDAYMNKPLLACSRKKRVRINSNVEIIKP